MSTVRGRLRADVGLADLVRATFPPASVTGAPKPRVLQAIEDLEPVRRGVYCGAVGWIDADRGRGRARRSRSARSRSRGGRTHLGVGGGIVADSEPDDEWAETELKARAAARGRGRGAARTEPVEAPMIGLDRRRRSCRSPTPSVSVLDHGLVVGDGVFETLRVYGGVPFAWTRHLARLRASADGLGLALPDVARAARRGRRGARRRTT